MSNSRIVPDPPTPIRPVREGFVYLAGADDGPIKVGFSANPEGRLATPQIGSAFKLRLLLCIRGTNDTEREHHRQLADWRIHGEWFERTAVLSHFGL